MQKFSVFLLLTITATCSGASRFNLTDFEKTTVSCRDSANDEYRLNLIPNPLDCSRFYQCEAIPVDTGYVTAPVTARQCDLDENGIRQYYDFMECKCKRQHEAICYNHDNRSHREDFFRCTDPFTFTGEHEKNCKSCDRY